MKKIIYYFLLIAVTGSLIACKAEEKAPIELQTITATQPADVVVPESNDNVEPSVAIEADVLLQNNAQTTVFDTLAEYENKLHELGFIEFKADLWRDAPDAPPSLSPIELTYNDDAFKLIFDYTSYHYETKEATTAKGWVLYGTKANAAINISNYRREDFDSYDILDMSELNSETTDFVHQIDYLMYRFGNDTPDTYVRCSSFYYADSGNVYNLAYEYKDVMNVTQGTPHVLAMIAEDITANIDWDSMTSNTTETP